MAVLLTLVALLAAAAGTSSTVAKAQYTPTNVQSTTYGYSFDASTTRQDTAYPSIRGEVIFAQSDMLRLRLFPTVGPSPYIIPTEVFPQSKIPAATYTAPSSTVYTATIINQGASLDIAAMGRTVASFDFSKLILDTQMCNMTFAYPKNSHVSGYGERNFKYFLSNEGGPVTLSNWNTDNLTPWANPMYGIYPVVFVNNPLTATHMVVMQMNSHAQQATIDPTTATINMIFVGGVVDFHVFIGATALEAMAAYQKYIGPAEVPPYWALGTHQCKYGWDKLQDLEDVLAGYEAAEIPLQTLWNDIDYMHTFHIFTVDKERYAGLRNFTEVLRAGGRRYVQIIDPGVAVNELNYSVYQSGEAADVFMKRNNQTLVGVVWPGWTTFPDFTNPKTTQWWTTEIQKYFAEEVVLDGMWTDMDEIASFCGGSCPVAPGTPWTYDWHNVNWDTFNDVICERNGCGPLNTTLNYPPFNPLTNGNQLFTKTLDMEADTYMGKYYNIKPFYGNMENIATHSALSTLNPTQRPFIITRSTFTGAGRNTFHWAGDNTATWGAHTGGMRASIQSLQAANMGGIFMSGSDIPGFTGPNTTEPLADRWYQIGAYYTFMRNHRDIDGSPQEPYRFSKACQVGIKGAIMRRYRLLPFIFSGLMAGRLFGTPVFNHPSLVFSDQPSLYEETYVMMLGKDLLVVPVVEENSTTASGRIPMGMWYSLADELSSPVANFVSDGSVYNYEVPKYSMIPALQRAGSMIPMHNEAKMLVQDTQATGHALVFAMTAVVGGEAKGDLIIDTEGSGPIPANYGGVFTFKAQGGVAGGMITVNTPTSSGANAVTAPVQPESYVLLFPTSGTAEAPYGFTISNMAAAVDGVACTAAIGCSVSTPVPGKLVIAFAQGTNAAGGFQFNSISWTATMTPSASPSAASNEKWKTPFIAATAVLGSVFIIAVLVIVYIQTTGRRSSGYEEVSEPVLPQQQGSEGAVNGGRANSKIDNRL